MKLTTGILGVVLVLACGVGGVSAQTGASTQPASAANTGVAPTTYRLTYTVTELDGTKHMGTQHFSLTVSSGNAQIKLGSKVPIVTGSSKPDGSESSQVQYVDVGLNISANVREFSSGVALYSKLEQSGMAEEQSPVGRNDPVIRQAVLENTALLTAGKPVMLGSLDVPGSTRHLDIEVVLEVVR